MPLPTELSTSGWCRVVSSGVKFSRTKKKYNSRELNAYLLHGKDNSQELLGNPNHNPSQEEKAVPCCLYDPQEFEFTISTKETNPKGPSVF
ncbi:predicted protein [Botrytis cinerea T4]|uniref:Uncharacterized protein n=1 Tax=Botryotinia fuckeliana (strain T4) TaxID=999810 RepID=G2Y3E8_BOTF4|nr:predicted protein [Botrytis cinerea T4]